MENKILVMYVGVAGIRSEDITEYVNRVTRNINPKTFGGEIIVIPTQSQNTKIECINPEYITDNNLVKEHTGMIKKLQEELQNQLEQLKENKNE